MRNRKKYLFKKTQKKVEDKKEASKKISRQNKTRTSLNENSNGHKT